MKKLSMLGTIGGAALLTAAPFSLQWPQKNVPLSLDSAEAAGVSRRVHLRVYRRAVYGTPVARVAGTGYLPPISLHQRSPATTYRLTTLCHLTATRYLSATVTPHLTGWATHRTSATPGRPVISRRYKPEESRCEAAAGQTRSAAKTSMLNVADGYATLSVHQEQG
jgi:hypothetical protein